MRTNNRRNTPIEPGKTVTYKGIPATITAKQAGVYRIQFSDGATKLVHRGDIKRKS